MTETKGFRTEWLGAFDAEEIKRIHESGSAKRTKREWIKRGYSELLSLYGVVTDVELDESGYKRIEILSNVLYTERIVLLLFDFFDYFKPVSPYTIWIYDRERDSIRQVGAYQ